MKVKNVFELTNGRISPENFESHFHFLTDSFNSRALTTFPFFVGSYGWSGEAVKGVTTELEGMNFRVVDPGLKIQYVPTSEGLEACRALARKIAAELPG